MAKGKQTAGYFKACMKNSENYGLACNKERATSSTAAICVFLCLILMGLAAFFTALSNRQMSQDDSEITVAFLINQLRWFIAKTLGVWWSCIG